MKKIFIASDHRGFAKKAKLLKILQKDNYEIVDLGPNLYNPTDDFNDGAIAVSREVLKHPNSFGILLCGSASGVCIQANRFQGVRAVVCYNQKVTKLARTHNDANIICLPANFTSVSKMLRLIHIFANTNFDYNNERFVRRNQRLDKEII